MFHLHVDFAEFYSESNLAFIYPQDFKIELLPDNFRVFFSVMNLLFSKTASR